MLRRWCLVLRAARRVAYRRLSLGAPDGAGGLSRGLAGLLPLPSLRQHTERRPGNKSNASPQASPKKKNTGRVSPEPPTRTGWDHLGEKGPNPSGATWVKCQRIAVRHRHGTAMGGAVDPDSTARCLVHPGGSVQAGVVRLPRREEPAE
jgi:hypothetical protein